MNSDLNKEPTDDEIYVALKEMHPTKAPRPDKIHSLLYEMLGYSRARCDLLCKKSMERGG